MTRSEYFELRNAMYEAAGTLGTFAELDKQSQLDEAYARGSEMLDEIDTLGVVLGFIDPNTNGKIK